MNQDDIVIMTTDGMVECRNADGKQFGVSKLIKTIQKDNFIKSPIDVLKDDISNFNQLKFDDDVSVITIVAK
jgi:serine phosphatase RsbU (regulator of sigma subunit)